MTENTPEYRSKKRAHEFIMKFHGLGISWEKSKLAAVAMTFELQEQYLKHVPLDENKKWFAINRFEQLRKNITDF